MCHSVVAQRVCETCGRFMGEVVVDFEECARTCSSPFYCMTPIPHMEICTMCASTANCPPIRSIHVPLESLHPINSSFTGGPHHQLDHHHQLQQRRGSSVSTASSSGTYPTYPSSNSSAASSGSATSVSSSSSSSSASHEPDDPLTTRGPGPVAAGGALLSLSATSTSTSASSRRGAARKQWLGSNPAEEAHRERGDLRMTWTNARPVGSH